jgi:hypothetical protein
MKYKEMVTRKCMACLYMLGQCPLCMPGIISNDRSKPHPALKMPVNMPCIAGADVGTAGSDMPANVAAGPGIVAAGTCEQGAGEALEQLRARLLALPGIGPYAANNLLQVSG